jgi:hypothetical protein
MLIRGLMETQIITNIDDWVFDFTSFFPSADTISSTTVTCSPAGLVELSAKSSTSGLKRTIVIDAASATASTKYILGCQCTSSSGLRHTLYKEIYVIADETGATAIAGSTGYNALYTATLTQVGSAAPSAVVHYTSFSGTIAWTRTTTGLYVGTLTGAFIAAKTVVRCHLVPYLPGTAELAYGSRASDNTVQITVQDIAREAVDGFTTLEIDIQTYT